MMNSNSINAEDNNVALLFEQVLAQMIYQCILTGKMNKHQMVVLLEDLIQLVERGNLRSTLDSI